MAEVAVQDLRNRGGEILNRVAGGETLTVTRDGDPVAELRPLPKRPLQAERLLALRSAAFDAAAARAFGRVAASMRRAGPKPAARI